MTAKHECPICDGGADVVRERAEISIGKRSVKVSVERMRCPDCDEAFYTPDQMDAALVAASSELRKREDLLQGDEIRAIRNSLRLTQRQFEQLLGLGEKTVVRWERGVVFQNRATDLLIRLVGELPQAIPLLSEWNGIELPPGDLPKPASAEGRFHGDPKIVAIETKMKDAQLTRLPGSGTRVSMSDITELLEVYNK